MKFLSSEKLSQHKYKTPEGYLICTDAILARTGKQTYQRCEVFADAADDLTEIEIDRKAEEVFSPMTLASFENKPITVEHPDENVTPNNYNDLSVGFVRDVHKGNVDGQDVMLGTLVITDAKTIEEIENGEHTDLSCGYDCDIVDEANPQQRNIRGNHVALCQQGRAGIARIVDSVKDDIVFDYTEADLDKAKEMLIAAKTDDEKKLIKSLIAKIEFELKSKELNDEDNNNEDAFIQAHSDAKAMYEEIISREAMTEEEAKRLVYKYFKGKDSITDAVFKIERYKNVDIYKDETNNLLADFSKTSTGKRLQRLNTKNINKAKEIIDDMIDFITVSLIQSSSKDEQKPYAITPRRRWQSNKKLEQFFTSLEEAKYVKNASEKADGIDYVVVDTRTMRIVDGKKTFTIKTEDKDNIYIAKIRANNAIEAFNKFNNKK